MTLSKREKILLYILALVIVITGGWIGVITPLQNQVLQQTNILEDLRAKQQEIEMMLPALEGVEERLADEEARRQSESYFYRNLQDVFIDRTISDIAQRNGASIKEIRIDNPVMGVLTPFQAYSYQMEEAGASSSDDSQSAETEATGPTTPLYQCTVSIFGTEAACIGAIAELNDLGKSAYVSEFSLIQAPRTSAEGPFTCEIRVNFYFLGAD